MLHIMTPGNDSNAHDAPLFRACGRGRQQMNRVSQRAAHVNLTFNS